MGDSVIRHDRRISNAPMFMRGSRGPHYPRSHMLRLLSSLIVALALFFSPLAMANGSGMAASHSAAAVQAEASGPCVDHDVPSGHEKSSTDMSCASACAAVPGLSAIVADEVVMSSPEVIMAGHQVLIGIHPEGETPPPRISPEI